MSDSEMETVRPSPPEAAEGPRKRDHRMIYVALAFGLGLVALIALNMN